MPTERRNITLGASATNASIFQGSIFETMKRPTRVQIYARSLAPVAAATGTNIGIQFGSRTMALQSQTVCPGGINATGGTDFSPKKPEDVIVDDVALPGEKIVISLQDRGGGTDTQVVMDLTEG